MLHMVDAQVLAVMMELAGGKARLGTRLGQRTVTVRTLSSFKDSINQRLCIFQKFEMLILFLSSRFILRVGLTTIRTLMSFLAPEHDLTHLDDCIPRVASQDSYCICSSSQGATDSLMFLSLARECTMLLLLGLCSPSFKRVSKNLGCTQEPVFL